MATSGVRDPSIPASPLISVLDHLRRPLYTNALFIALTAALTALGGFAFWTLVARLYTPEQVGLGSATISALTLLATIAGLGLDMGLIRYFPTAGSNRAALLDFTLTAGLLAGFVAAGIFLAGIRIWSPGLRFLTHDGAYVFGFLCFAAANTAGVVLIMAFVALRNARYLLWIGMASQLGRLALVPLLRPFGAFGVVACGGASMLLTLITALILLMLVEKPYRPRFTLNRASAALLIPFGLGNHAANLALTAPVLLLPLMVVNVLGASKEAHFYIAFSVGNLLLMGTHSLATSLFAEGSHDQNTLLRTTLHALTGSLLLATLGTAVMFVIGGKLLLAFGTGYAREGMGVVRLIALATIPSAVVYVVLPILRVRKQLRALISLAGGICLVTLAASYVLMLRADIAGPGYGVLAGQSMGAAVCLAYFVRVSVAARPMMRQTPTLDPSGAAAMQEHLP